MDDNDYDNNYDNDSSSFISVPPNCSSLCECTSSEKSTIRAFGLDVRVRSIKAPLSVYRSMMTSLFAIQNKYMDINKI